LPCQAAATSPPGSPVARPARSRTRPRWVSCSWAVSSSLRMRYSGSRLRPRWPRVAYCTRRRTWSTTSGRPWSATARMMVAQPTPKSRATAATAWASCQPADRPRPGPARSAPPRADRGRLLGPGPHPTGRLPTAPDPLAPAQHHRRPPLGRSRTRTVRRPWASARTPQPTQPTTVAVVWTSSCHSPPSMAAARISKPSRSSLRQKAGAAAQSVW